jgi:prokaryotic ubiquitin-like protein Pup
MAQEQKQPRKSSEEAAPQEEVTAETDVAERKEALDDDIDAILDEIDEVLTDCPSAARWADLRADRACPRRT